MNHSSLPRFFAALALSFWVGCGQDGDSGASGSKPAPKPAPKPAAKSAKAAPAPMAEKADSGATTADSRPKVEWKRAAPLVAGHAMGFVTKEAWFVLRLPNPSTLYSKFEGTALGQALRESGMLAQLPSLTELIERGRQALGTANAEALKLADALMQVRGEVVVALLDVDPSRLERGNECPLTAAAFLELGPAEEVVASAVRAALAAPGFVDGVSVRGEDLWLIDQQGVRFEVMLRNGCLCVLVGPPAEYAPILDDLAVLKPEHSFLRNAVATATPMPLGEKAETFAEMSWSLASLPAILGAYAPEAHEAMVGLGFDKIAGFGMRSSIDGALVSDSYAFVSPGRSDPFTMVFESGGVDPNFARYTLPDAEDASVFHFDLARTVNKLKSDLPSGAREAFAAGLAEADRGLGMSLQRDVLALFGSQIAFSMKGSFALLAKDPEAVCEMVFAIELKDGKRFAKWFEKMIGDGMIPASPRKLGAQKAYAIGIPLPDAPSWLEICFAQTDDAFVVATTFDALTRVVEGAATGVVPARIDATIASAPRDAFGVSVSSAAAEVRSFFAIVRSGLDEASAKAGTPNDFPVPTAAAIEPVIAKLGDATRFWRATDSGLEIDQRSPIGNPLVLAMPLSIVAAVAIPNLLQARSNANETAAIATLRNYYSAQAQFQVIAARDADGDGNGEYGTLGEMMGMTEIPGLGKLDPPLLASTVGTFESGRYTRSGYHFQVYLPDTKGRAIAEAASGGRDSRVDAENAEIAFAIYAWPVKAGNTGLATFMIDSEGEIYRVAPGSRERPYSGLDDAPDGDAAYGSTESMVRGPNPTYGRRLGRDGAVWEPIGY